MSHDGANHVRGVMCVPHNKKSGVQLVVRCGERCRTRTYVPAMLLNRESETTCRQKVNVTEG